MSKEGKKEKEEEREEQRQRENAEKMLLNGRVLKEFAEFLSCK